MKISTYEEYIKENKEDNFDVVQELKEVAGNYLAYLTDDDYEIKITDHKMVILIEIHKVLENRYGDYKPFEWVDVKDYVVPFIDMLYENYNCSGGVGLYVDESSRSSHGYSKPHLDNDQIDETIPYYNMHIFISRESGSFKK